MAAPRFADVNENITHLYCGVLKLYCLGHNICVNHEPATDNTLFYMLHDATRQIRKHFDRRATRLRAHARPVACAEGDQPARRPQPERARRIPRHGAIPVGRVIDRLEKTGFVERRADPGDRRRWRLYLTPKAHAVVDEMEVIAGELRDDALRGIARARSRHADAARSTQMKENLAALDAAAE